MKAALHTGKAHKCRSEAMKIELLKNSFRGATRQEEATLAALAIVPRKRRQLPVAGGHFDTVNETRLAAKSELLSLAAATFDPRRISQEAARSLREYLEDSELLSVEDAHFLKLYLELGTEESAIFDLYSYFETNLPEAPAKTNGLALLNDIHAQRFRAAG